MGSELNEQKWENLWVKVKTVEKVRHEERKKEKKKEKAKNKTQVMGRQISHHFPQGDCYLASEPWLLWTEQCPGFIAEPCVTWHKVPLGHLGPAVPAGSPLSLLPPSACSLWGQSEQQRKPWHPASTRCVINTGLATNPKHSNVQAARKKITPSQTQLQIMCSSFPPTPFPSAVLHYFFTHPLAQRACLFSYHILLMTL